MPSAAFRKVDFPDPFGPTIVTISPASSTKSMSRSTGGAAP